MIQKFAVIGHPIKHTMSPYIHKKLFELSGLENEYYVYDINPDDLENECENLFSLQGFNITIPHKTAIIPFLNSLDKSSKIYGTVNCVSIKNGEKKGYSTDAYGFSAALKAAKIPLKGKVLIIGCGGAAETLAVEANLNNCEIVFGVRTGSEHKALSIINKHKLNATVELTETINTHFDLCVNATPCGMYPNAENMPLTEHQILNCSAVFDSIYNPFNTKLLSTAKRHSIPCCGGMDMLVWQAVKAHFYWYGAEFNESDIKALCESANHEMEKIFYEK